MTRPAKISIVGAVMAVSALASLALPMQAQVDRTKPPVLGPPPSLHLPPVAVRELPNGLKILVVERHELPMADFVLLVPGGGATANPADHAGLADLAASMLTGGTKTRDALQVSDQAAYLGISLSSSSAWDAAMVRMSTPTAQLDSALALFADVVINPTFPATEFARVKTERLTALLQLKDRGPAIATLVYPTILYGKDNPYGRSPIGTDASVQSLTAADLASFYASHYAPNGSTLIVVGDVTPAEIERKVRNAFGAWARRSVPAVTAGPGLPAPATTIYLIDKPSAAQSSFRIGSAGVPRNTPDYFPLTVINTTLGGSFTSRLNQDLREDKGYTYGASSAFDMRKYGGPFTASAEVVSAKSDSALIEFMKQLRAIRDTIPQTELSKTKRYIQLELPSNFETNGGIAGQLAGVALYGLPLDYYNHVVADIGAVTQAQAQQAAVRYIDPAHLTVLIVGDRKSIEAPIRALNIGPIVFLDSNGNPVQ
ncbi:MAG: insulinase family protein [Gemmatimonadota bacterium]|nr:insulinase family protein [Gemmatimonadota bacterium]